MNKYSSTFFTLIFFWGLANINAQRISEQFKAHWFDGRAEISSYILSQSRYGENREGTAVMIYVTEDFLKKEQVKANQKSKETLPVLKLNRTKKFLTGIYPYSIMSSSFSQLRSPQAVIKNSASIQEWCGQSYLQMNHKEPGFNIISHSYFEGEADENFTIENNLTEDELWNLIRLKPHLLPQGKLKLIPSLESSRMNHKKIEAYPANASLEVKEKYTIYTVAYPLLKRYLSIKFLTAFPHTIEGWVEQTVKNGKESTSTAKRIHTERRRYWNENDNASEKLRIPFKLD